MISNILESNNRESWSSLNENGDTATGAKLVSTILDSADKYGRVLSLGINTTQNTASSINYTNLVMEAKSLDDVDSSDVVRFSLVTDSISISSSALKSGIGSANTSINIWSVCYRNIKEALDNRDEKLVLNSAVLSLTVQNLTRGKSLKEPVNIILKHNEEIEEKRERSCVYWNFNSSNGGGSWSDDGCRVVSSESKRTVCSCSHLTNFAVLMSRHPSNETTLSVISTVGSCVSVVTIILTIVFYAITWKQSKSHQAAVLLNLCLALVVANVIFVLGADKTRLNLSEGLCKSVAVLLHYFFLAAFFMMLAEGIQLFLYVVFIFHAKRTKETALLIAAAWVLPMVIVAVSVAMKIDEYGAKETCWLSNESHLIWAFAGPAFAILGVNVLIMAIVFVKISTTKISTGKASKKRKIRGMLWNIAVLCPVLGLTWSCGILSISSNSLVYQYIFSIANSFQGLFVFVFHVLFQNQKLNDRMTSLFPCCQSVEVKQTRTNPRPDTTGGTRVTSDKSVTSGSQVVVDLGFAAKAIARRIAVEAKEVADDKCTADGLASGSKVTSAGGPDHVTNAAVAMGTKVVAVENEAVAVKD